MPTLNRRTDPRPIKQGRNNRAFYQSSRWHTLSRMYRKANPLCVQCKKEGRLRQAQEVDHIVPIQQGGDRWDINNLQSLCKHHHSQKTINERRSSNQA